MLPSRDSYPWVRSFGGSRITIRGLGFLVLALLIAVASLGLGDVTLSHAWSTSGTFCVEHPNVRFAQAFTNDDGVINDPEKDPQDDGIDPGYDKDVAQCQANIKDDATVLVNIANGFPSYTCRFWVEIRNVGDQTLWHGAPTITAPPELTMVEIEPLECGILHPGEWEFESFTVHIEQPAQEGGSYQFEIAKEFVVAWGGTVGFWKNWDSHHTFTKEQIEGWLAEIKADSAWLNVTTIAEMEAVFKAGTGKGATPETRFLAQYLATRLNVLSGIFCPDSAYDITGINHYQYLGLDDPHHAKLGEIVAAIESKHGTSPANWQFEAMKDLCDAINNLELW
jgi:hypothetical protein